MTKTQKLEKLQKTLAELREQMRLIKVALGEQYRKPKFDPDRSVSKIAELERKLAALREKEEDLLGQILELDSA